MSGVEVSKLSDDDKDELVCSYAALMLHDDGLEITVSPIIFFIFSLGREIEQGYQMLEQFSSTILAHALRQGT